MKCDEGTANSDVLPGACRTTCALPFCGDGVLDAGEACDDGKLASNWVQQDVLRSLRELQVEIDRFPVSAAALGELLAMVQAGKLTTSRAREVLAGLEDERPSQVGMPEKTRRTATSTAPTRAVQAGWSMARRWWCCALGCWCRCISC